MTRKTRSLAGASRVAVAALVAALLFPGRADASKEEALQTAKGATVALAKHGFEVQSTLWAGMLPPGGRTSVEMTLYEGNEYLLVVGGCQECQDIDLAVYDENWKLVTRDQDSTHAAGVVVRPSYTGTHHVVIEMYKAAAEGAHWTLVTGFR
jgi:hypothetical protein